jgi:putative transposase
MLVHRAAKFCCEPSPYQAQSLGQWVGACRHEYNLALERRDYEYKNYGFSLAYVPQAKELTGRRASLDWLNFAPVHALQNALRDLDEAFDRFFKGLCRHPTPRKKFINDSFTLPAEDVKFRRVNKNHGIITLPKIGDVKFRGYRDLGGKPKSVTFRRKAGKWFASLLWEKEIPDPPKSEDAPIGIDRGVAVFAATSVGELIDPVNAFDAIQDKLAKLQRKLARKVKFSSNWRKVKEKISRLRMHEANARKDFLHKETTKLAKSHGVYRLEKLRVRNMTASAAGTVEEPGKNVAQKSGLNRSILDQRWSMFATFLGYKEEPKGGRVEFTPAPYTSLRCPNPNCGHTHPNNRPTRDRFCCEMCGYEGHADVVGAINVSQGRILPEEPPKRIRKRVGKRKLRSAEAPVMANAEAVQHAA